MPSTLLTVCGLSRGLSHATVMRNCLAHVRHSWIWLARQNVGQSERSHDMHAHLLNGSVQVGARVVVLLHTPPKSRSRELAKARTARRPHLDVVDSSRSLGNVGTQLQLPGVVASQKGRLEAQLVEAPGRHRLQTS